MVTSVFPVEQTFLSPGIVTCVVGDRPGKVFVSDVSHPSPWDANLIGSLWRNITTGQLIQSQGSIRTLLDDNGVVRQWLRVDCLSIEHQLEWALFRLTYLDLCNDEPFVVGQRHEALHYAKFLAARHHFCVYRDAEGWRYRAVPQVKPGDRVRVVWARGGQEDDIGCVGTVGALERYLEHDVRVFLDGQPLGRILSPGQLEILPRDRRQLKLLQLKREFELLQESRESILKEGDIYDGWIEEYDTVKANGTKCGPYHYFCHQITKNGKRATQKKLLGKREVAGFQAGCDRYRRLKAVDRQIKALTAQIDKLSGNQQIRTPDTAGKYVGQWDVYDTREGGVKGNTFAFVVFQWVANSKGGLKRGPIKARFRVNNLATESEIETARQKAIDLAQDPR